MGDRLCKRSRVAIRSGAKKDRGSSDRRITIDRGSGGTFSLLCACQSGMLLIMVLRMRSVAARSFVTARVESVNGNRGGQQRRCLRG